MSSLDLTTRQIRYWKLLFYFPEGGAVAQLCVFSLVHRRSSVFCLPSLSTLGYSHRHFRNIHKELAEELGEIWAWHLGYWGAHGPVVGILKWGFPSSLWVDLLLQSWTQSTETTSLKCSLVFSWSPLPTQSWKSCLYPGYSGTEKVFSSSIPHSWGTWTLSHFSPFSLRRGCCQLVHSQAVQPWGTGGTDKFLLTLSNTPVLCLFLFFGRWYLSSVNQDFYKASFTHGCMSKSTLCRCSPTAMKRGWSQFTDICHFHNT